MNEPHNINEEIARKALLLSKFMAMPNRGKKVASLRRQIEALRRKRNAHHSETGQNSHPGDEAV